MTGRAFALHSARDATRREAARRLVASCGLEGELWPAVELGALSSNELSATVATGLFAPVYPFTLTTPEIARFLSHRQVWAETVRQNLEYGLILEEGAALDPAIFSRALDLAQAEIDDLGYIRFQTQPHRAPARLIDTNGSCALSLPLVSAARSPVQMIGREAAVHLLRLTETFDRPVDYFIQSHWHTRLRPAGIYPSGVSRMAKPPEGKPRLTQAWTRYLFNRAIWHAARESDAPVTGGLI